MPIAPGASNKARQKNIATEVAGGTPVKQAVAIGYSEQRAAKKRQRKASDWSKAQA